MIQNKNFLFCDVEPYKITISLSLKKYASSPVSMHGDEKITDSLHLYIYQILSTNLCYTSMSVREGKQ